jgi:hypothetical protein
MQEDSVDGDMAWDLFSRWADEAWGATLQPTVVYSQQAVQQAKAAIQQKGAAVQKDKLAVQ